MAELKVGDEIKLSESHPRHPGKKGKVMQVFPTGFVKVRLESGEADVELKSNIAANARWRGIGTAVAIKPNVQSRYAWLGSTVGKVVRTEGNPSYEPDFQNPVTVKFDNGKTEDIVYGHLLVTSNSAVANSTNPVVAKAVNATSKNAIVRKAMNACAVNGPTKDEATAKRDIEQSLRKMADFATKFTGAKTTPSSALNDPMYSGYIELTFPTEEESANFNPYYLINKLGDDKSLLPRWAWGIYGFNYNRNGQTWRIKIGRFAT